jgi:hypothetical protein
MNLKDVVVAYFEKWRDGFPEGLKRTNKSLSQDDRPNNTDAL